MMDQGWKLLLETKARLGSLAAEFRSPEMLKNIRATKAELLQQVR
jgi:hypothetical protein